VTQDRNGDRPACDTGHIRLQLAGKTGWAAITTIVMDQQAGPVSLTGRKSQNLLCASLNQLKSKAQLEGAPINLALHLLQLPHQAPSKSILQGEVGDHGTWAGLREAQSSDVSGRSRN
jgi:hypothetical protein